jgi:hypothetical protein
MLSGFSLSFVYSVGSCPVERVNCPPDRAEPGIIRRNAVRRGAFPIHLVESRSSYVYDRAKRRFHRSSVSPNIIGRSQNVINTVLLLCGPPGQAQNFSNSARCVSPAVGDRHWTGEPGRLRLAVVAISLSSKRLIEVINLD